MKRAYRTVDLRVSVFLPAIQVMSYLRPFMAGCRQALDRGHWRFELALSDCLNEMY